MAKLSARLALAMLIPTAFPARLRSGPPIWREFWSMSCWSAMGKLLRRSEKSPLIWSLRFCTFLASPWTSLRGLSSIFCLRVLSARRNSTSTKSPGCFSRMMSIICSRLVTSSPSNFLMMSPLRMPAASAPESLATLVISIPLSSSFSRRPTPSMTGRSPWISRAWALMMPTLTLRLDLLEDPLVTTHVPCSMSVGDAHSTGVRFLASILRMARSHSISDASRVTLAYRSVSMIILRPCLRVLFLVLGSKRKSSLRLVRM